MTDAALIVHFMAYGFTACGRHAGAQNHWPEHHRWVSFGEIAKVTCAVCLANMQKWKDDKLMALSPRFTDMVAAVKKRGPDRVIINGSAEATTSKRARDTYAITPVVIFIRDDGWSLGAPSRFEGLAERLWKDQWIGVMRRKDNGDWTEELYNRESS